jgi:hypothetical protein
MPNNVKLPSEVFYAGQGSGKAFRVPLLSKQFASNTSGDLELIRPVAALTNAYVATGVVDVSLCSQVMVLVKVANTAAGDIVSFVPEVCVNKDGDGFYPLSDFAAPSVVTLGANPDSTVLSTGKWSSHTVQPLEIKTASITTNADLLSFCMVFDVSFANQFRMLVRADAGTPNLTLSVARKS